MALERLDTVHIFDEEIRVADSKLADQQRNRPAMTMTLTPSKGRYCCFDSKMCSCVVMRPYKLAY